MGRRVADRDPFPGGWEGEEDRRWKRGMQALVDRGLRLSAAKTNKPKEMQTCLFFYLKCRMRANS